MTLRVGIDCDARFKPYPVSAAYRRYVQNSRHASRISPRWLRKFLHHDFPADLILLLIAVTDGVVWVCVS